MGAQSPQQGIRVGCCATFVAVCTRVGTVPLIVENLRCHFLKMELIYYLASSCKGFLIHVFDHLELQSFATTQGLRRDAGKVESAWCQVEALQQDNYVVLLSQTVVTTIRKKLKFIAYTEMQR